MSTIMSALVALSALAAVGSPANAASVPRDSDARHAQWAGHFQHVQKAVWSDEDQKAFWEQEGGSGG